MERNNPSGDKIIASISLAIMVLVDTCCFVKTFSDSPYNFAWGMAGTMLLILFLLIAGMLCQKQKTSVFKKKTGVFFVAGEKSMPERRGAES